MPLILPFFFNGIDWVLFTYVEGVMHKALQLNSPLRCLTKRETHDHTVTKKPEFSKDNIPYSLYVHMDIYMYIHPSIYLYIYLYYTLNTYFLCIYACINIIRLCALGLPL